VQIPTRSCASFGRGLSAKSLVSPRTMVNTSGSEPAALEALASRERLRADFGSNALTVFAIQLRFGIDDPSELADSVVDGPRDKKCDVVYIHEESGIVVVVQSYLAEDPSKTNPPLNKASDLNIAASWLLNPTDPESLPRPLRTAGDQLGLAIREGDVTSIEFWYAHNLAENDEIDVELAQAAATAAAAIASRYGPDVAGAIECRSLQIGRNALDRLFAQRTTRILIDEEVEIPASSWISEAGDGWSAVCTSVPGPWLRELVATYGSDRLFSGNIRDYLGRQKSGRNINYTIEQTAEERPRDFWAFNNGLTILVHELLPTRKRLKVKGLTIVNGAQTTGALASAKSTEGVSVLARFVAATDNDLIEQIIRANNTQNAIRASDFRSSDPHQRRLRTEFDAIPGVYYAGARRGEAAPAAGDLLIGSDQAAQALAAFHGSPERAYHGKGRIWEEDALYAQFFGDHTTAAHIVFVVSLHHSIVSLKRALRSKEGRTESEDGILDFLAQRGALFILMAALGRCQEDILGRRIADRFRLSFGDAVSPDVAEEYWSPLVNSLASFHAALQPAAESGRIRVKEVRDDSTSAFAAQVQAVRPVLGDLFEEFATKVVD